jgi:hypothetical protein
MQTEVRERPTIACEERRTPGFVFKRWWCSLSVLVHKMLPSTVPMDARARYDRPSLADAEN